MRRLLFIAAMMLLSLQAFAGDEGRYIEVSGTAEVEIVPDEIHYIIEMKRILRGGIRRQVEAGRFRHQGAARCH